MSELFNITFVWAEEVKNNADSSFMFIIQKKQSPKQLR